MAVWGRAITVLALLAALTGCEYTAEGDPRPSALQSSPSPVLSAPPESTPDPERVARMERNSVRVNELLGPAAHAVMGGAGGIGDDHGRTAAMIQSTGPAVAAGDYVFKVACVGDKDVQFQRFRNDSTTESFTVPCGKVFEIRRTLPAGKVTVELAGRRTGTEAAGGFLVVKAPPKAAPKP